MLDSQWDTGRSSRRECCTYSHGAGARGYKWKYSIWSRRKYFLLKLEFLKTDVVQLWIATIVHLIGVEIYLGLTPREAERLRQVSYERQLKAGYKHPGSAGLTSDRWGDAEPWKPKTVEHVAV